MVTKEEARQALKTIAQYCDEVDCYECEIKEACEKCEHQDRTSKTMEGKVLVNADALEKFADFIDANYFGDCDLCPANGKCWGGEPTCREAIKAYLEKG